MPALASRSFVCCTARVSLARTFSPSGPLKILNSSSLRCRATSTSLRRALRRLHLREQLQRGSRLPCRCRHILCIFHLLPLLILLVPLLPQLLDCLIIPNYMRWHA